MSVTDPHELGALLNDLDSWLYLRVERATDCVTLRVRDAIVGTLDLKSSGLLVNVPSDMAGMPLKRHPQLQGSRRGVTVRVCDTDSRTAAEALLRWRVDVERFGPQLRAASP